ncbi:multidrug DMT transporter permease [Streptomyces boninensis]|uniref:EamA family transporter n=1 Tax=Streptomyces boninensis TaxID=2039455 RepID=UPI003B228BF1
MRGAAFRGAESPSPAALGWGAVSGVGTGAGVALLYVAMNSGAMSVVVPVSDVIAMGLPVVVGLALLGDRASPAALVGIAVALPSIWLVSRGGDGGEDGGARGDGGSGGGTRGGGPGARRRGPGGRIGGTGGSAGVRAALAAGVGFALHFLALARIPEGAGLWPIAVSRAVSIVVIAVPAVAAGLPLRLPARALLVVTVAGALGTAATTLYWLATTLQPAALAVVLAALYPAVPVLLALAFLGERCGRRQTLGLVGAGCAIALIALG